jgi:FKBP-type peptidyl-prolyl cis-trans isomerase
MGCDSGVQTAFPTGGSMKYPKLAAIVAMLLASSVLADDKPAGKAAADPDGIRQKASYALGLRMGRSVKPLDLDLESLKKGLSDALADAKPALTDEQMDQVLQAYESALMAKKAAVDKPLADKNKKDGDAFLAANQKKPGVKTLPSGLQYKVIKDGTGLIPKKTDVVQAHYKGTLIDGTEFDSSVKRGTPITTRVDGVIPGWVEALQLMKVGSKWQLFVPPDLAYGATPPPGSAIGPNSVLVFEVELLKIERQ